jgi:hypothetical protein
MATFSVTRKGCRNDPGRSALIAILRLEAEAPEFAKIIEITSGAGLRP